MGNERCKGCQSELVLDAENLCAYCELAQDRTGEIKPNVNCGTCKCIVEEDTEGLFCDVCNCWFHNKCNETPLNHELYALLNEAPDNVKWFCDKCIWETEKWIKGLKNKYFQTSGVGRNSKKVNKLNSNKNRKDREKANEESIEEQNALINEDDNMGKMHEEDNEHNHLAIPETIIEEYDDEEWENEEWENEDSDEWDQSEEEVLEKKEKKKRKLNSSEIQLHEDDDEEMKEKLIKKHMRKKHSAEKQFKCTKCDKRLSSQRSLHQHMLSHRPKDERPYACDQCDARFGSPSTLKNHRNIHNKGLNAICDICGKSFRNVHSLKAHKMIHTGEKLFKCTNCDKKLSSQRSLHHHMLSHRPKEERPYACDQCDARFGSPSTLKNHRDIHTDVLNAICDICGKSFRTIYYLKVHKMIHTGEKPFKCEVCDNKFKSKGELNSHLEVHKDKSCICEICEYATFTIDKLNRHMKTVHNENIFECDLCDKKYKSKEALNMHNSGRQGFGVCKGFKSQEIRENPFECRECGKKYASIKYLKKHMKFHATEMPFECTKCDRKFPTSGYLNRHMISHRPKEERPYACDQCDARYNKPSKLKYHKQIHTGVLSSANKTIIESDKCVDLFKSESEHGKTKQSQILASPKSKKIKKESRTHNKKSANNESGEDDSTIPMQETNMATERMFTAQHHGYQPSTGHVTTLQNHETNIATYHAMQNHGFQPPLLLYSNSQNSNVYAAQYHGSLIPPNTRGVTATIQTSSTSY